jgi:hypothetical protein
VLLGFEESIGEKPNPIIKGDEVNLIYNHFTKPIYGFDY